MATRVTLKMINDELARLGYSSRLAKASSYFYFHSGEAADWLDRTVNAAVVSSHTLAEWIDEFHRLQKLNDQIGGKAAPKQPRRKGSHSAG